MASHSQALTRKPDMELMPPPPPAKRIKRPPKVLDEDTYTDALSDIIARDFFPGLLETKHQQEYLSALASHDPSRIAEASRRLTEVMTTPRLRRGTSFSTPLRSDTPLKSNPMAPAATPTNTRTNTTTTSSSSSSTAQEHKAPYDKHLSLDAFQAKYTSEDNASFNTLLDAQNEKKRNAYAFLWAGNRIPGFRATAHAKRAKALAQVEAAQGGPTPSIAWKDDRKPVPNTWKAAPRNTLMFAPDGHDPPPPPPATDTATAQQQQQQHKDLPPKTVVYANTRMPPPPLPAPPPSPSFSAVRDAIAGRPRPLPSESGAGADTPRVNGYSFVKDAPSPSPSELGAPPLTWGSIAALTEGEGGGEGARAAFKIAPTPRRELLHHRMVDRVARNKRPAAAAGRAAATTPRHGALGLGQVTPGGGAGEGLTPAGRRLWSSLAGRGEGEGWPGGVTRGGRGVATPLVKRK
ncbi:nuclear protein DGCR14 [Morchella snyderi]|nr:nuclear protein DGCR14 [Morchella snyderi]